MKKLVLPAVALSALAAAALAHQDVQDPDVTSRMNLMMDMAAATKTLGRMAKGQDPFDPGSADAALSALRDHARTIPEAFESAATDPVSEARPSIWNDWDGFTAASDTLVAATETRIAGPDDLRPALRAIGQSCSACHRAYRAATD